MDTGIENTLDRIGSTMDRVDSKLKGLSSKFDEFFIIFLRRRIRSEMRVTKRSSTSRNKRARLWSTWSGLRNRKHLRSIPIQTWPESYFVSSFISEIDSALRPTVKMMHPVTIKHVVEVRLQELALKAIYRKHGLPPKGYLQSSQ